MLLFDFSCLCIVLVFAHKSDSQFIVLQDYDDEAYGLNRGVIEPKREAISISPFYRSKKAILEFGRHTLHLDDFEDLKVIRAKTTKPKEPLKDNPISYVDVNNWEPTISAIDSIVDHPQDLLILSGTPLQFCNCEHCVKGRKSIRTNDDNKDQRHKKDRTRYFKKRFAIVDNRHQSLKKPKRQFDSSEEYNYEKKKSNKEQKKKKQNVSSKSMDSNSEERSIESWESSKKKKYNSEESRSREYIKKPTKYRSIEDGSKESRSIEDIPKIKKKKKHVSSDETESKAMDLKDYYFMQGNQIFSANDRKKKKSSRDISRKRLQQFLPKRYHWEPEEIHDLGYFWFNGPKGLYPAPKPL